MNGSVSFANWKHLTECVGSKLSRQLRLAWPVGSLQDGQQLRTAVQLQCQQQTQAQFGPIARVSLNISAHKTTLWL